MVPRLAVVLSLLFAGVAQAQTLPPPAVTFPPPSPMSEEGVRAWVAQYIDTAGWRLVGADPGAVSFLIAEGTTLDADGMVSSQVRREYFGAPQLGPLGARSVRQAWVVDCQGHKVWVRKIMLFSENNLKGHAQGREAPQPRWTEVSSGSINDKLMGEICAAAKPAPDAPKSPA